jgi:hypothetical protein
MTEFEAKPKECSGLFKKKLVWMSNNMREYLRDSFQLIQESLNY